MKSGADVKVPFRLRLRAWWEGEEIQLPELAAPSGGGGPKLAAPPPQITIPPLMPW